MKLRISIGVLAIVAVLALAWVFGVAPQLQMAAQHAQATTSVDELTNVYQARLRALTADRRNLTSLKERLAAAEAYIPSDPSLGAFLAELNQLEAPVHVQVTAYQAGDPVPAVTTASTASTGSSASTGTAPSSTGAPAVPSSNLYQIPVQVQVTGSYDKIVDFTGALEKGSRLFVVDKVSIGASQTGAGFSGTIVGEVYVVASHG